jgi:hypothetical protein
LAVDVGEGELTEVVKSAKDTVCGVLAVTSFPCRCFGGGGFFFGLRLSLTRPALSSSSSDREISYDVRGVSCTSWTGSNSDCREIDEVSVLLLLSTIAATAGGGDWTGGLELVGAGAALPVINNLLNASTSKDALAFPGGAFSGTARSRFTSFGCENETCLCGSMFARVRWKGFGGAPAGEVIGSIGPEFRLVFASTTASSSSESSTCSSKALSNGSFSTSPGESTESPDIEGGGDPE